MHQLYNVLQRKTYNKSEMMPRIRYFIDGWLLFTVTSFTVYARGFIEIANMMIRACLSGSVIIDHVQKVFQHFPLLWACTKFNKVVGCY